MTSFPLSEWKAFTPSLKSLLFRWLPLKQKEPIIGSSNNLNTTVREKISQIKRSIVYVKHNQGTYSTCNEPLPK